MSSPSQPENNPLDTRIRDLPPGIRKIFYVGVGFMIYGLAWFFFGGHIWTDHSSKQFAAVGLIGMGLLYAVGGAQLMSIYRRWIFAKTDELRARAKVATFVLGCVPIVAAFMFNVMVFWHMTIEDSYTVLKVKATEPVKEELRWLLGDNYPEGQEGNIDPVSLEWNLKTNQATTDAQSVFLKAHSPQATDDDTHYFDSQLNDQIFEVKWKINGELKRSKLDLDWDAARLKNVFETEDPKSYPMCELTVPILNNKQFDAESVVLINGEDPVNDKNSKIRIFDTDAALFNRPEGRLPRMLRVSDGALVIRTNFMGAQWPTYCAINFSHGSPQTPEPVTFYTMANLHWARFQLHFYLFSNLRENILYFDVDRYRRQATFPEFLEQVNELVALDILKTEITGTVRTPWY